MYQLIREKSKENISINNLDYIKGKSAKEIFGVIERFSTYSAVIFTGILGIYGFKVFKE